MPFIDFEQPIAELQAKIDSLRLVGNDSAINIQEEIARLEHKSLELTRTVFANLTDWQRVQLARHPDRPYFLDYLSLLFSDFDELHGDRCFADDPAIVTGTARFNGIPVVVMGHQKGRDTKEKVFRNFGMASPEGYRKVARIMKLAEKFNLPIFTFIDTSGAYPGIGAEERGQSQAIAQNLSIMSRLKVPIICTVIGEGGSGGALGMGVGDRLLMMEYSVYSTISPEGCASILWKNAQRAADAAEIMGMTADKLVALNLIDAIVPEPLGGAHRDLHAASEFLKSALELHYQQISQKPMEELLNERYQKLMQYGT